MRTDDDALTAEIRERADEAKPYFMQLGESDCMDLAAGTVPRSVQARAMTLLEDLDSLTRKNAARPTKKVSRGRKPVL